jgi:serine phosphatase RsbU (regulator of sigma subunit)
LLNVCDKIISREKDVSPEKGSIRFYQTITFKLFAMISVFLGSSVAFMVSYNFYHSKIQLQQQLKDNVLNTARKTSVSVLLQVNYWESLSRSVMTQISKSQKLTPETMLEQFNSFLNANSEIVSMSLVSKRKMTDTNLTQLFGVFSENVNDARYDSMNPKDIYKKITSIENSIRTELLKIDFDKVQIFNLSSFLSLPISLLAIPFPVDNKKSSEKFGSWLLVYIWQTNFIAEFESSKYTKTVVFNHALKPVLVGANVNLEDVKKFEELPLFLEMKKSRQPFSSGDVEINGQQFTNSFSQIPEIGYTVFVLRDAFEEIGYLKWQTKKTLLISALFILISVAASFLFAFGMTKNLKKLSVTTNKIAEGGFHERVVINSKDEVGILGFNINNMANKIQKLLSIEVEAARQAGELKTAKAVQETLLPKAKSKITLKVPAKVESSLSGFENTTVNVNTSQNSDHKTDSENSTLVIAEKLQIQGFYHSASECAGDWWGHFSVNSGKGCVFVVADATGHGASAALLVAVVYSFFNVIEKFYERMRFTEHDLQKNLKFLNEILVESGEGNSTMTMFVGYINIEESCMHYINAGHVLPFFIPKNGSDIRLPKSARRSAKKTDAPCGENAEQTDSGSGTHLSRKKGYGPLLGGGSLLGLNLEPEFKVNYFEMSQGDKFLIFTDGLTENTNQISETMGTKLKQFLSISNSLSNKNFIDNLNKIALDHFNGQAMKDDVTLFSIEFLPRYEANIEDCSDGEEIKNYSHGNTLL